MVTPKDTIWEIESHTLAKHELLRRYLGAWFPILGAHNRRIVYIDGFCGPGQYKGGEPGSPILALTEALKHKSLLMGNELTFLFMDERSDRIEHLNAELSRLSLPDNFTVRAVAGQFDVELTSLLDDLETSGSRLAPTFAFIDPFGFKGLPFDVVRRLLANPRTEVLVNVMADAVNRFLEHPDTQTRQHIIDLFGTKRVPRVAGEATRRIKALRRLYQEQLSTCAEFVRFFEMQDCHGRIIYYLFFAGNHRLGHVKIKEAFWKVDPASGFCFSDATNPDQLVLFEVDETPGLAAELADEFAKRRAAVAEVRAYVEDETPFVARHMREALKLLEKQNTIVVSVSKLNGKRRRRYTFPDNAVVEFS